MISFLLKPFESFKWHKIIHLLLVLVGIWTYSILTGSGVSVQRACVMLSIYGLLKAFQRNPKCIEILLVSAFLLLSLKPSELFGLGFQLSYSAMLGIFLLYPKFSSLFGPRNMLLKFFWNLTSVSLAAQLGTLPLISYYFGEIAIYSLLSNLLVSPVLVVFMATSILNLTLAGTGVARMLFQKVSDLLIQYVHSTASFFSVGTEAMINHQLSELGLLALYMFLAVLLFGLKPHRMK